MSDLYHQVLLEELAHPQNKTELANADVSAHALNASCGDDMTVFVKFNGENIAEVTWQGSGCAISQATMSMLSSEIQGHPKNEVMNMQIKDLEELIGIKKISPGRVKCLMLGLNAVQAALKKAQ